MNHARTARPTWSHQDGSLAIYVAAAVYFLGTFCWLALDPVTPIERGEMTNDEGQMTKE